MAKYSYYKLSKAATLFTDPKSGLVVRNKEVVKFDTEKASASKKVTEAVRGGHLREATEEEYNNWLSKSADDVEDELEDEDNLTDPEDDENGEGDEDDPDTFTKSELIDAIKDAVEIPEEEKKSLSNRNKEDLVALYKKYIK